MPKVSDLKDSKFLKKEDVDPAVRVTIAGYEQVNVAMESQAPDMKWALTFKENIKPMILNQTNGQIIASIAGSQDFDDWAGLVIVVYNDPSVMYAGKMVGGVRVRAPRGQARNVNLPPERNAGKGKYAEPLPTDDDVPATANEVDIDDSDLPF